MNLFFPVRPLAAAALAVGLAPVAARAADMTPPPAPAPVAEAAHMPTCETCNGGGAPAGCSTCGGVSGRTSLFGGLHHGKVKTVPNICPGSCFGYFQTKWSKWEEVCSHPYQGVGVSDAPRPPIPPLTPVGPGARRGPTAEPLPPPMPQPMPEPKREFPSTPAAPPATVAPPVIAPPPLSVPGR